MENKEIEEIEEKLLQAKKEIQRLENLCCLMGCKSKGIMYFNEENRHQNECPKRKKK